jgi:hypothetical protein
LLFLNHPEGILLSALKNYKNELLAFYKSVSNKDDLNKMTASIDDVINTKTNAIYVHLSRIKSTITKLVHPSIAEHYFIDGGKNKSKKAKIRRHSILWDKKPQRVVEIELLKEGNKSSQKGEAVLPKFKEEIFWDE